VKIIGAAHAISVVASVSTADGGSHLGVEQHMSCTLSK
jgi:hypothetical protein